MVIFRLSTNSAIHGPCNMVVTNAAECPAQKLFVTIMSYLYLFNATNFFEMVNRKNDEIIRSRGGINK